MFIGKPLMDASTERLRKQNAVNVDSVSFAMKRAGPSSIDLLWRVSTAGSLPGEKYLPGHAPDLGPCFGRIAKTKPSTYITLL